ncbi:MAG: hypothetical protein U9O87_02475 [Verrucomicrobiota bacterium]|nr:hypothetical protein [Verrucomicrobiota bacterium]
MGLFFNLNEDLEELDLKSRKKEIFEGQTLLFAFQYIYNNKNLKIKILEMNKIVKKKKRSFPVNQGLYDSANEHDACGVGFVCNIDGEKSHKIVQQGIQLLNDLNTEEQQE